MRSMFPAVLLAAPLLAPVTVTASAGPVLERVRAAAAVRVAPPATRGRELEAGRVDVFMTDYPCSRRLLDNTEWATLTSSLASRGTAASRPPPGSTGWRPPFA